MRCFVERQYIWKVGEKTNFLLKEKTNPDIETT